MNFIISTLSSIGAMFLSFIYNLPLILLGILGLCLLVVFHEFGHFIFCKIFNVYTPSFSIGFGPRLFEKKIGETVFAISAIPLGGYVEIAGSQELGQGEQVHAKDNDSRSFNNKPYWQKLMILSGGILFNIMLTYLALSLLFYLGSPCIGTICQKYPASISIVKKDSLADKSGLEDKDKIIAVNNVKVKNIKHLNKLLSSYIDKKVNLKVEKKDGNEKSLEIQVNGRKVGDTEIPELPGVFWQVKPMSLKTALQAGFNATYNLAKDLMHALKNFFKNKDQFGGPISIVAELNQSIMMGWKIFAFMLAFISLNLAVINLVPLPIFDGGQILFYTIEAITGKPLSDKIKAYIHYISWIAVILFTIYLTYKDLSRIGRRFTSQKTEIIKSIDKTVNV